MRAVNAITQGLKSPRDAELASPGAQGSVPALWLDKRAPCASVPLPRQLGWGYYSCLPWEGEMRCVFPQIKQIRLPYGQAVPFCARDAVVAVPDPAPALLLGRSHLGGMCPRLPQPFFLFLLFTK